MGKPRLIILVRHGQSEGNKNRDIHQTIPDHRVKLTSDGWQQAYEAGRRLREMLRADDTLHFFTSPYRRARETTEGILTTLTSDEPDPSPFQRQKIKVYEEPRLREQDFGNFQPCSAEMERMWQERADYGHFFYRIPNGESAADAYDRISGFNESLWRQFGEDDFASVCVLVTHGLMSRVFLMKWYHFSVEYFEDLRNINHCEFLIMRKSEESGKYVLENNLRTWSELKRERAALRATKEKEGKDSGAKENAVKENGTSSKDSSKLEKALGVNSPVAASPVEVRRKWGGCPDGCNHDKAFKIRQNMADLVQRDSIISSEAVATAGEATQDGAGSESGSALSTPSSSTVTNSSVNGHDLPNGNGVAATSYGASIASRRPAAKRFQSFNGSEEMSAEEAFGPHIDITKARDEVVSSPDGTPSFISVEDRLRGHLKSPNVPPPPVAGSRSHAGRDFGGTYSGHNSAVASEADSSEDDHARRRMARLRLTALSGDMGMDAYGKSPMGHSSGTLHCREREHSSMGRGMRANRVGDHPHGSDSEHDADVEHENDHDDHDDHDDDEAPPPENCLKSMPESNRELDTEALERVSTKEFKQAEKEDRSLEGSIY